MAKNEKTRATKTTELDETDITLQVLEAPLANLEIRDLLQKVLLQTIGEKCKKVLCWHSAGYSMQEIGKMLKMQKDSAKNLKFKCLKKLTDYFDDNPNQLAAIKKLIYA